MSTAKLVPALAFACVGLAGCGIAAKPVAGTPNLLRSPGNHARLDDQRHSHYICLRRHGLPATTFTGAGGRPGIQVGPRPGGATIVFEPTPGAAQELQIQGDSQGAMVIGSALVYPNRVGDAEMRTVAACVALGVTG
jgi:hypothetical protein